MRVLVTGGAGYIGSHAVRELANQHHMVTVLDTLELGHRELALRAGAHRLVVGSTGDAGLLDEIFVTERPEAVMHFVAYKAPSESMENPARYFANNVTNTLSLLDAMIRRGVRFFIGLHSGKTPAFRHGDTPLLRSSPVESLYIVPPKVV